jgi:hypothetical protein
MMKRYGLPAALLVVFAITRTPGLLPQNFSAMYAVAFCAGVYFPRRQAWLIPLGLMLATDCLLDFYYWFYLGINPFQGSSFVAMAGNYGAFAAIIALGRRCDRTTPWVGLAAGGLAAAVLFYLITNTFAWMTLKDYPKTLAGLVQALTIGLPRWPHTWEFFRNTLSSGGLFTGLFAGAMKIQESIESAAEPQEETEEAEEEAKAEG